MRCGTVFFDLDGTLIDTSEGVIGSVRHALSVLGYPVREDIRSYYPFLGPPLPYGFGVVCGVKEEDIPRAIEVFRTRYVGEEWYLKCAVYPGIPALLSALRDAGYKLAVTTSKQEEAAIKVLKRKEIYDLFDAVFGASPAPERQTKAGVLRAGIEALGTTPSACVLVGDRKYDAEGASEVGLDCIAALWGFGERDEFAPYPIASYAGTPSDVGRTLIANGRKETP